ncbi:MAG: hypothetical protein RSE36_02175 [Oscillospiraceae bacterium]
MDGDMLKKQKRGDMSKLVMLVLIASFVAVKLLLVSTQMTYVYQDSVIDDGMMFSAARKIVTGNWLGAYNWLTLGKHMFFSVWLALLILLRIPYLIGGQLLYLAACLAAMCALAPIFKKRWLRFMLFLILWLSPYSTAQYTLRVYRDNIFPSLCLLFFAGVIGFCLRYSQKPRRSIVYAIIAGIGLALAWLTREDGAWLLPFGICAAAVYALCVLLQKQPTRDKILRLLIPLSSAAVAAVIICSYCAVNYAYYGRFIVSDFTSREFNDAVGAMIRADTDAPHEKILVCRDTRMKIYSAVPMAEELGRTLDSGEYYGSFGSREQKEFWSGGFCWALRHAVNDAGFAENAVQAREYYAELAAKINAACDSGAIKTDKGRTSSTLVPFDSIYIAPTLGEFGRSLRCLLLFEQTEALAEFSNISREQHELWSTLLAQDTSYAMLRENGEVIYSPTQKMAGTAFSVIAWCYRILIFPLLALGFAALWRDFRKTLHGLKNREQAPCLMQFAAMTGILLSLILRVAMISYIEVASFKIGTYLLYLGSCGPLILMFAAYGLSVFCKNEQK